MRLPPRPTVIFIMLAVGASILLGACGGDESPGTAVQAATVAPVATVAAPATATVLPTEPPTNAASPGAAPSGPGSDPRALGEEIYQKTAGGVGCQYCHGSDASGGIGPAIINRSSAEIAGALDRVEAMSFILLETEEILAVAEYLAYLGPSGTTE